MTERVVVTQDAAKVIRQLKEQHGNLMFHQSGGCCDGSSPMCFPIDELMLDDSDVFLGEIESCAFYMSKDQFDYWQHTQLIINITHGRGASFSLEIPLGLRFITESRVYTEAELSDLRPIGIGKQ
ncbi:UDP-glucose 4-epimerase [marine bacterium AO1-C]|nr:UDP-glucose 4-epimerase [marine bacterium AO1-C]